MEESAEESNVAGEQYEEEIVPKVITDEVFEEVTTRAVTIIRDLQNSKQYLVAEDLQKLILVTQNLRQNVIDEKEKIEQMKAEVIASQQRVQHAVKMSKQDQEIIQQLKSEIGMKKLRKSLLITNFASKVHLERDPNLSNGRYLGLFFQSFSSYSSNLSHFN